VRKLLYLLPVLAIPLILGSIYLRPQEAITSQIAPDTVTTAKEDTRQQSEAPTVETLLARVNEERAKVGVNPLTLDPLLNKSAQMKSDDMFTNKYFAHVNPKTGFNGPDYMDIVGVKCMWTSENIRANNGTANTTYYAMKAWMNSPTHKAAILDPRYDTTGFGINGYYLTQHFCDLE
jgi:uncharacterized protein YkwD